MTALLLAGTAEARELSHLAAVEGLPLITSLAGVTGEPAVHGGRMRTGGFGGAPGLADWLRAERISAVIDATHPFAARISGNAAAASAETGVPLLRLERPAWDLPGGRAAWREFDAEQAALAALPGGARALMALGRSGGRLGPPGPDVRLYLRVIEAPPALPDGVTLIQARPPFTQAQEEALFRDLRLTHLICRNAGGLGGRAKLDAAAALGMAVWIVRRPALPAAATVATPQAALAWLRNRVANPAADVAPGA